MMEELMAKLKTYLHMETELAVEEFSAYYKDVIAYLNANFEQMEQETLLQALYICSIVQANAEERAKKSKATAKVFRKIGSKCGFWKDALNFRLLKHLRLSQQEIDSAMERINDSM